MGFIGYRIWGVWGGYLCGSGVGEGSMEGHSRRTHGIKARLEYMGVCRNKGPQAPQHVLIRPEEPLKKPTNLNSIHPNIILASPCRIPPVRDPDLFRTPPPYHIAARMCLAAASSASMVRRGSFKVGLRVYRVEVFGLKVSL